MENVYNDKEKATNLNPVDFTRLMVLNLMVPAGKSLTRLLIEKSEDVKLHKYLYM